MWRLTVVLSMILASVAFATSESEAEEVRENAEIIRAIAQATGVATTGADLQQLTMGAQVL